MIDKINIRNPRNGKSVKPAPRLSMLCSLLLPQVPPQLAPPAPMPVLPRFELSLLNPTPIPIGTEDRLCKVLLRRPWEWLLAWRRPCPQLLDDPAARDWCRALASSASMSNSSSDAKASLDRVLVYESRLVGSPYSDSEAPSSTSLACFDASSEDAEEADEERTSSSSGPGSSPKPFPSTSHHVGTAATIEMAARAQNGTITYPCLTPKVKRLPPMAGPAARPTAETLVASPLIVPSTRRLLALFVNMIVDVGNAKVPPIPRMTSRMTMATSLVFCPGKSDTKGVTKKTNGKTMNEMRRQRRTPR